MSRVKIDRRLYLVEDRSHVVEDGDPDAHWLFCVAGGEVERSEAARYGLLGAPEEVSEEAPAEAKARTPSANKARTRSADK